MTDNEFIDVSGKDEWNEVPQSTPPVPQVPEDLPEQLASEAVVQLEPAPEELTEPEAIVEEAFPQEAEAQAEVLSEAIPPQPSTPLYDPVATESEPYVEVTPKQEGFTPVPPAAPVQPPKEKKNKTLTIVLIILLVLCVCVFIGIGVVLVMVGSGRYTIEWSYLINDLVRLV